MLLGTNVVLIKTVYSYLDLDPYLKGQRSHKTFKGQSKHARICL